MRKQIAVCFIIASTIFLSCSTPRYIYSPPPPNITYFQNKGDNKITAYYSSGGNSINNNLEKSINHGWDIQAAYALSNHWMIAGSYSKRKERESYGSNFNIYDTSTINYSRSIVELGSGYFTSLNTRKTITFNAGIFVAMGKFKFTDSGFDNGNIYERFLENNVTKYSLQAGFNLMPSPYIHLSFTGRISSIHYNESNTNYSTTEIQGLYLKNFSNSSIAFWEPTFNIEFGVPKVEWLKISAGATFCARLQTNSAQNRIFNGSIGLTLNLPKQKK